MFHLNSSIFLNVLPTSTTIFHEEFVKFCECWISVFHFSAALSFANYYWYCHPTGSWLEKNFIIYCWEVCQSIPMCLHCVELFKKWFIILLVFQVSVGYFWGLRRICWQGKSSEKFISLTNYLSILNCIWYMFIEWVGMNVVAVSSLQTTPLWANYNRFYCPRTLPGIRKSSLHSNCLHIKCLFRDRWKGKILWNHCSNTADPPSFHFFQIWRVGLMGVNSTKDNVNLVLKAFKDAMDNN